MTCVIAAGFNITTVLWSRDDTTISDNHRITTTLTQPSDGVGIYSSQLTIDPVMFDDCGVYRCSAIGVSSPTVNSSAALSVVGELNGVECVDDLLWHAHTHAHTHTRTHTHTHLTILPYSLQT